MKKYVLIIAILILVAGVSSMTARYFGFNRLRSSPFTSSAGLLSSMSPEASSWKVEEFVTDLEVPWSMVFTSPERMLVTERPGRVRVIENGQLLSQPLHTFSEVSSTDEEGLMSLVVAPDYVTSKKVYASLAYPKEKGLAVKVVSFTDQGTSATNFTTILDDIPAAQFHSGSRLRFGPDGKLFIATGDATNKNSAQDLNSLAGKILRLNPDGSIPSDNPFPNSPIYSYGHRNPQGLDWHPVTQALVSTEHGPSLFDGPAGGDEVNLILAGKNYGWPLVSHEKTREGTEKPLEVYTPAEAPASGMFYRSSALPMFQNNYFFGALKGEGLIRLVFDPSDMTKIVSQEKLFDKKYGRIRDVAEGPDGSIYFSSSNRDGRGISKSGDDKIYRIVPE